MGKEPRKRPSTKAKTTPPAEGEATVADAELLRRLDASTRHALERLQEISASTSKLIADLTRDALDKQGEAMERTAAAAERLLRPPAGPAGSSKAAPSNGTRAGKGGGKTGGRAQRGGPQKRGTQRGGR